MRTELKKLLILYGWTLLFHNFYSVIDGSLRDCLTSASPEEFIRSLPNFEKFTKSYFFGKIVLLDESILNIEDDNLFYRFKDVCPEDAPDKAAWTLIYYFVFHPRSMYSCDDPEYIQRKYRDIAEAFSFCSKERQKVILDLSKDLYKAAIEIEKVRVSRELKIDRPNSESIGTFKAKVLINFRPVGFYDGIMPFLSVWIQLTYIARFKGLAECLHCKFGDPTQPLPPDPADSMCVVS